MGPPLSSARIVRCRQYRGAELHQRTERLRQVQWKTVQRRAWQPLVAAARRRPCGSHAHPAGL